MVQNTFVEQNYQKKHRQSINKMKNLSHSKKYNYHSLYLASRDKRKVEQKLLSKFQDETLWLT